ncbi:Hypothetical predicted protein [Cloeon dipterum]|uniref:Uncharacterized protein n=1 Tax=Cloeon dipterum TaxID=197152 RepID=A0A8S1BQC5_9INSE|nr:Hypothetical predicted protein [Cloeon dipterum]
MFSNSHSQGFLAPPACGRYWNLELEVFKAPAKNRTTPRKNRTPSHQVTLIFTATAISLKIYLLGNEEG